MYFGASTTLSDPLVNLYTETYTLFVSLQRIVASSLRLPDDRNGADPRDFGMAEVWDKHGKLVGAGSLLGPLGAETIGHMRRLVEMYLEEIGKLREAEDVDVRASTVMIWLLLMFAGGPESSSRCSVLHFPARADPLSAARWERRGSAWRRAAGLVERP